MAFVDLPLEQLRSYAPDVAVPADFDAFWARTLAEADAMPLEIESTRVETGLTLIETFDLAFTGAEGARIRAWLHVPSGARHPLPAVVEFTGYASGRGLPVQNTLYAQAGYAHLVMDNRGQGHWAVGDTPDPSPYSGSGVVPGYLTRGILDREQFYYRRLFTDAVRAVAAARALPQVDPGQVVVAGASQGGAIALAAAAFAEGVTGALIDIPFFCYVARAITITDRLPYRELTDYLARYRDHEEAVLATIAYFDGVTLAARTRVPALYSVALMDLTCPPSTVFAAYNAHRGDKEIVVYPYNDHEGGAEHHATRRLGWLAQHLAVRGLQ